MLSSRFSHLYCAGLLVLLPLFGTCQYWSPLGLGLDRSVRNFHSDSTEDLLFICGNFKFADEVEVNGLTVWDGGVFDSIGAGDTRCFNNCGPILDIATYNQQLYVAGHITEMGNIETNGIARWDGEEWAGVAYGVNQFASTLEVIDGLLYVGGVYDSVGGNIQANGISTWDGQQWHVVGNFPNTWGGFNYMNVSAIKKFSNEVYVGGLFREGSGLSHSIARWNGTQWNTVGENIQGVNVWINDMEIYNGELYIAGYFFREHGNLSSGILRWDGSNWRGIGDGVEFGAQVFDLQIFNDNLYASGNFTSMSGINASRIAKWNGEQWCGLGSTFNNSISSTAVYRDTLYVACGTEVDGIQVNYLAKWLGDDYVDTCVTVTGIKDSQVFRSELTIHPNPTNSTTTLTWQSQNQGSYQLSLYDVHGRLLLNETLRSAQGSKELDMSGYAKGIYFGRLLVGEETRPFGFAQGKIFKVVRE